MSFNLRIHSKTKLAEYFNEAWSLKHVEVKYSYTKPTEADFNHPGDDPELKIIAILAWPNDEKRKDSINITDFVSDKFKQYLTDNLLDDELNKRF